MHCPVCDYPDAKPELTLADRFFETSPGPFVLYSCPACRTLFQDPDAIRSSIASFYPAGYWWKQDGRGSRLERAYRDWMVRNDHLRFVLSLFKGQKRLRCLDIGCGEATFVRLALAAGLDAYGLEQSEDAVLLADLPGRIFQASERELIEKGEKFQLITLFHSLEHMLEPFAYLRGLQKLLVKPGGLIVQVPNRDSLQSRVFGRRWYGLDCPRHVCNYSLFAVLYLLGKAGYRIRSVRHFSLRDNAAAMVSSLFPALDPMSQKVKRVRRSGSSHSGGLLFKEFAYLGLLLFAQPLAALEAALGRGGTVTVYATLD
ncbi:MAG: class I SAM-dependent methyltransferase [Acidobacteria bacterium]|nr:MAG: class I SAM-dependent methyltransferase [Acidobacteriota bacterium]